MSKGYRNVKVMEKPYFECSGIGTVWPFQIIVAVTMEEMPWSCICMFLVLSLDELFDARLKNHPQSISAELTEF